MKKSPLVLMSVFILFFSFSCSEFDPETDGKLVREACNLPLSPKTKKLDEREIFRPHAGVISNFYSHESGCPVVENYYQTVLIERGWEKVPYSYFRNHGYIEFKKGEVSISLRCSETGEFTISCSKGLR